MTRWIIQKGEQRLGPWESRAVRDKLREGALTLFDLASSENSWEFREIRTIDEIFSTGVPLVSPFQELTDIDEAMILSEQEVAAAGTQTSGAERRANLRTMEAAAPAIERKTDSGSRYVVIDPSGKNLGFFGEDDILQMYKRKVLADNASVRMLDTQRVVPLGAFVRGEGRIKGVTVPRQNANSQRPASSGASFLILTMVVVVGVLAAGGFALFRGNIRMGGSRTTENAPTEVRRTTAAPEVAVKPAIPVHVEPKPQPPVAPLPPVPVAVTPPPAPPPPRIAGAIILVTNLAGAEGKVVTIGPLSYSADELERCGLKCTLALSDTKGDTLKAIFFKAAHASNLGLRTTDVYVQGRIGPDGHTLYLAAVL